jgi:hypothetical protein
MVVACREASDLPSPDLKDEDQQPAILHRIAPGAKRHPVVCPLRLSGIANFQPVPGYLGGVGWVDTVFQSDQVSRRLVAQSPGNRLLDAPSLPYPTASSGADKPIIPWRMPERRGQRGRNWRLRQEEQRTRSIEDVRQSRNFAARRPRVASRPPVHGVNIDLQGFGYLGNRPPVFIDGPTENIRRYG